MRVLEWINRLCVLLTGIALVVLTVIFGWLVFGRYVLNATPTWVEQVSLLLVALITFVGAAIGIHEQSHLAVTFFRDACPRWLRQALLALSHIIIAGFGLIMCIGGYELTVFKWGSLIPLIQIPEGVRTIPVMLCGGLLFLFSLGHLIALAQGTATTSEASNQLPDSP